MPCDDNILNPVLIANLESKRNFGAQDRLESGHPPFKTPMLTQSRVTAAMQKKAEHRVEGSKKAHRVCVRSFGWAKVLDERFVRAFGQVSVEGLGFRA